MITQAVAPESHPAPNTPQSGGTRRTYHRAWVAFERWSAAQGVSALPARPDTIARYLQHLAFRGIRASTIRVAHNAIADAHVRSGHHGAAVDPHVKMVLTDLVRRERVVHNSQLLH